MKRFFLTLIIFALANCATADEKTSQSATPPVPITQKTPPDESSLASHKHYVNRDGQVVHSPSKSTSGEIPAGATARCGDGSYSFSKHHSGTCSHHGGVAIWL